MLLRNYVIISHFTQLPRTTPRHYASMLRRNIDIAGERLDLAPRSGAGIL